MDDTLIDDGGKIADGITRLLAEHKAVNPVTLDLRRFNLWTDFFVVAGVTSTAHLDGLRRRLEEWADENQVPFRRGRDRRVSRNGRSAAVSGEANLLWDIFDMGNIVVHLMSKEAREFYELEKLWL
jgi:ribosome-associated protein